MFQAQPTSYAGGVFTRGGLPRYPRSSPMAAYADGALGGCASCSGMGAIDWRKVLTAEQQAALLSQQSEYNRQRMLKIGLIGVSVLAVGAIGYFVLKGK